MAREYTRSPSPTGSSYSKRSRGHGDRHDRRRRDDDYRRRRSRSPEVGSHMRPSSALYSDSHKQQRYRERERERERDWDRDRDRDRDELRRRDRSLDHVRFNNSNHNANDGRGEDDHCRFSRRERDRSRERRRPSRDRDRDRDRADRRRSRDRSRDRSRGDRRRRGSRDRDRRRRDESIESRKRKREDSRTRPPTRDSAASGSREAAPKPSTPPAQSAEEQKAAKLAKLEQWKRKRAEEEARKKQELEAAGGAKAILKEIDRRANAAAPASSGPSATSATPATPVTPVPSATPEASSPAPYGGKFDPKAIAQKAQAAKATSAKVLGADVAAKPGSIRPLSTAPAAPPDLANGAAAKCLKPGNMSRFGLGSKTGADGDGLKKATAGLDFGEADDGQRKKLVQLPDMANHDALATGQEGGDGEADDDGDVHDIDIDGAGGEDGVGTTVLAAARAAAEKRSQVEQAELVQQDATMTDAPWAQQSTVEGEARKEESEQEEDLDPLDAFMQELAPVSKPTFKKVEPAKSRQTEAFFSDDDGQEVEDLEEDNPDSIMAAAEAKIRKKKKDIPVANHSKIDYQPFRRNFYSEPVDMADMTEDEVASLRMELDNIKVRGLDVPKPVRNWAQCGLGVQSLTVIQKLGYQAPTSIQSQAIPTIMSGRDMIGVAKTGSGKTIAFLLPMFRHIKDQRPLEALDGPIGLILSPTRELATQIHKDCKPFLKALNLRAVCAYGGAPIKDQIADMKRGAEIVVCTPGRMIDLLAANSGRVTNLRRVTYVVLDEADRMFDMGFEPQVMKILANIRPDKQTVLFSATFPRQMEALARKTLTKPVEIVVGGRSVVAPEITQIVEVRADDDKFVRLLELLGNLYADDKNEDDRALVFVDRQESADGLLKALMNRGYPCMSIHGGKDQVDRDSTIQDFKAGVVPILIATSVAARGLDVKQLKLVVNYDAPNHLEDYVHRAGRTGRAGNTGTAVTFLTPEQDRYAVDIVKALKQSGQAVPEPVQALADGFMEKVKAGKEKSLAGGFGGKGLDRLDQQRDAEKARERKTFKSGEEGDDQDKDQDESREVKVGDDIFAKAASGVKAFDATPQARPALAPPPRAAIPGVPKGIDLDGKITVHKTERPEVGGGGGAGSAAGGLPKNQMDRVAAAVGAINEKLSKAGVMRSGVPIDNKGPDAGAFHATLEINDFPQKARWAVTNRTNVAKILESTGTSITTKGSFYPAGKEPGPGENPKLYILVEGDTEIVVQDAMRELMRLLKEGTLSAADAPERSGGRYSVV